LVNLGSGKCTTKAGTGSDTGLLTKQFTLTCTDMASGISGNVVCTIVGLY
jgi:hypothetical protein